MMATAKLNDRQRCGSSLFSIIIIFLYYNKIKKMSLLIQHLNGHSPLSYETFVPDKAFDLKHELWTGSHTYTLDFEKKVPSTFIDSFWLETTKIIEEVDFFNIVDVPDVNMGNI